MKTTKMVAILVLALVLGLAVEVANADFIFGTPMNLGPTVNSSSKDRGPSISTDGLELYLMSNRPGGYGDMDIWVTTRPTIIDPWAEPVNLGPTVNSSYNDSGPGISADGLWLFFHSDRPSGYGGHDLYVSTRETTNDPWGTPVNLGTIVNSSGTEASPGISADGLALYFHSNRPGSVGPRDIWMTARQTKDDAWGSPVNLGAVVNSSSHDWGPSISVDGLSLFFYSNRPGGYGGSDLWATRRAAENEEWGSPVNLGPTVNSSAGDNAPAFSSDGSMLYFDSPRPGGFGGPDLWQIPVIPLVDLNGDGIVDAIDMCIIVDHWGEDYSLCDIGPMPWGDGVVDVQDLIVLAEHLFEEFPPFEVEPEPAE